MYDSWVKKGECRFDQIWLMGFSDLTPVITVCSKKTVYSGPTEPGWGEFSPKPNYKQNKIKVQIFLEAHKNLNQSSTLFRRHSC